MQNHQIKHLNITNWFIIFLFLHFFAWSLVPSLYRYNLPLDAVEGALWGHQLELGYDKNPFLNGWLTAFALYLNHSDWIIYVFSQISVIACFISVWMLANEVFSPIYALVSVFLLETIQYYNIHAIDFNDNTLELGLWGFTIFCFYKAIRTIKLQFWMLTGILAGFGMMAKYYTAILLLPMLLFLLCNRENRLQLKKPGFYIALLAFVLIILPHFIWLYYHQFSTLTYAILRTKSEPHWINHFFYPGKFTFDQLKAIFPASLLAYLFFYREKNNEITLSHFDRKFLLFVGLGPFLLTLMISFLFGITLRAGWGMPLFSLYGIVLVAILKPVITPYKFYTFIATIFTFIVLLAIGYKYFLILSPSSSSANFPGRLIAKTITEKWRAKYHTKLSYVAGSRWISGNISLYSKDHPTVFIKWDEKKSPWIDVNDFQKKGAVFVWVEKNDGLFPKKILRQFPRLSPLETMSFTWHNHKNTEPLKIKFTTLPPI